MKQKRTKFVSPRVPKHQALKICLCFISLKSKALTVGKEISIWASNPYLNMYYPYVPMSKYVFPY